MEEWKVPYSDDELAQDDYYTPSDPNVIIHLYEAISKGEIPTLKTPIYPRREPDSETQVTILTGESQELGEKTPEKQESVEPTEFDFDTQPEDNVKRFTPRRTPHKQVTKKVASMANVYSNLIKYKKLEEEEGKSEDSGKK